MMTVKELIEQLKQYDEDVDVKVAIDYSEADADYVSENNGAVVIVG